MGYQLIERELATSHRCANWNEAPVCHRQSQARPGRDGGVCACHSCTEDNSTASEVVIYVLAALRTTHLLEKCI